MKGALLEPRHLGSIWITCYMGRMCGRITQKSPPDQLGLSIVSLVEPLDAPPRYNGAPGQEQWVIRQSLLQRLFTSSTDFGLVCGYLLAYGDQGHLYERNSSKGFSGNRRSHPSCC